MPSKSDQGAKATAVDSQEEQETNIRKSRRSVLVSGEETRGTPTRSARSRRSVVMAEQVVKSAKKSVGRRKSVPAEKSDDVPIAVASGHRGRRSVTPATVSSAEEEQTVVEEPKSGHRKSRRSVVVIETQNTEVSTPTRRSRRSVAPSVVADEAVCTPTPTRRTRRSVAPSIVADEAICIPTPTRRTRRSMAPSVVADEAVCTPTPTRRTRRSMAQSVVANEAVHTPVRSARRKSVKSVTVVEPTKTEMKETMTEEIEGSTSAQSARRVATTSNDTVAEDKAEDRAVNSTPGRSACRKSHHSVSTVREDIPPKEEKVKELSPPKRRKSIEDKEENKVEEIEKSEEEEAMEVDEDGATDNKENMSTDTALYTTGTTSTFDYFN